MEKHFTLFKSEEAVSGAMMKVMTRGTRCVSKFTAFRPF